MQVSIFSANNREYRQRQRAHRACNQCKTKRRRCSLQYERQERCDSCLRHSLPCSLAPHSAPPPELPLESVEQYRFIGHLNPETVFVANSTALSDEANVGLWTTSSENLATTQRTAQQLPPALYAYLCSISAFSLPPRLTREALISLYLSSVHPLLPIVDAEAVLQQHQSSNVSLPLLHAVLLVAARHPEAKIYFPSQRRFAQESSEKVTALLQAGVEKDKLTVTRIHALLSFHSEGANGNENASLSLSTAIHGAHSIGLHMRGANSGDKKKRNQLWWCLWGLDRLQAAMCGRPVVARFIDVGLNFPEDSDEGVGLSAWCRLSGLLGQVIALYRPGEVSAGWEDIFPGFEELVPFGNNDGSDTTLKLFYYSIAILSHRSPSVVTSSSYARRLESAQNILLLFTLPSKSFSPLPIVPYAASLALASFYSAIRHGIDMQEKYNAICDILTEMEARWWFAGAMARVGRKAQEKVEKRGAAESLEMLHQNGVPPLPAASQTNNTRKEVVDAAENTLDDGLEGMDEFLTLFPDLAAPVGWDDFLVGTGLEESQWWLDPLGGAEV